MGSKSNKTSKQPLPHFLADAGQNGIHEIFIFVLLSKWFLGLLNKCRKMYHCASPGYRADQGNFVLKEMPGANLLATDTCLKDA